MNTDQFIYIDGERVFLSDLNDRQKYLVQQISDIQQKIQQLQFSADQLNAASTVFGDELKKSREESSCSTTK